MEPFKKKKKNPQVSLQKCCIVIICSSSLFSSPLPLFFPGPWHNLLGESMDLLLDLLELGLGVGLLGGVHLVDGHDELLDAKGVDEQGVLHGLPVLGDTGLGELQVLHSGGVHCACAGQVCTG